MKRLKRFELSARRKRNRKLKCECGGFWFPHRIGSRGENHAGCVHSCEKNTARIIVKSDTEAARTSV